MKELIIHNMPQLPFAAAEALNQLRINLGFCGDQIRTIMMTSSVPKRGQEFPDHPAVAPDGPGRQRPGAAAGLRFPQLRDAPQNTASAAPAGTS